jgi:hypothetical protein
LHQVRKATIEDMPQIMVELKAFSEFYDSKHELFGNDDDYSDALIRAFIEEHVFFVCENDGEFVGFICGLVSPHIYNPSIKVLTESFWWVKPEHRGSKAGLLLLNTFIDFGKGLADWIICTLEDASPVNDSVFYKRGFKLKERSFLLEV